MEKDEEDSILEAAKMNLYMILKSLDDCDVILNFEPIECPICFNISGPQQGVILRDCLHEFCKTCITDAIRHREGGKVKCPFRKAEYTCESTLQQREIRALSEPELYQEYLEDSLAQAENNVGDSHFRCTTPDCPSWCYFEAGVTKYLCPVCGVNNCITCRAVHTGKSCEQYKRDKDLDQEVNITAAMLEEMVVKGEALRCPACGVVLMKKLGCDWVLCSMCKTQICWITKGPRWGPGGKGDTSGGCRCGVKGVKCHPLCRNCH